MADDIEKIKGLFTSWIGSKPIVAIICLFAGFAYGMFFSSKIYEQTIEIKNSEYNQLSDEVAQLKVESIDKDNLLKQVENKWNNEKKYLLKQINQITESKFTDNSKELEFEKPDIDNKDYVLQEVYYKDENSPPIGYVEFFKNGKVKSKTYNHDIVINTVSSKDNSGNYVVLAKAFLILTEPSKVEKNKKWLNKEYSLQIKDGSIQINSSNDIKYRKFSFDPSVTLNFNMLLNDKIQYSPAIGVSFMKYSNSKGVLLSLPEIQFGMNNIDNYFITLAPVTINIGNFIKIMHNTYIKPLVGINNNDFIYGFGVGLDF